MSDSNIAIRVEGLGKMYRLGRQTSYASTLTGKIRNAITSPFQWLSEQMRQPTEEEILWALKDVSFEVMRGEVVGFIGHNGAGKSTLLKLLSRITEPTTGYAEIHGRIAALLEVGTGMHPELTGRENIYMNGTVLGMKKREIDTKFDEIVDFSGIYKFMDTPVKRYSSGMRVRLGFAIAAHLEPEILVVDEVLAVGDADFQAKCLGKMQDVASGGRTVLFVSHNMNAIKQLCCRGILLNQGSVEFMGSASQAIEAYEKKTAGSNYNKFIRTSKVNLSSPVNVETFNIFNGIPETGRPVRFEIGLNVITKTKCELALAIRTLGDQHLLIFYSNSDGNIFNLNQGKITVGLEIEYLPLQPGEYIVNLWTGLGDNPFDWIKSCMTLQVFDGRTMEMSSHTTRKTPYPVVLPAHWEINNSES